MPTLQNCKNIYLICGAEDYLRARAVDALKRECDVALPELNISVIEEGAADGEIINVCDTLPMMSERRLVIVRAASLFAAGGGKAEGDSAPAKGKHSALSAYLKDVPETTVLVFDAPKADKRSAMYKAAASCGAVIACEPPKDYELPKFCERIAADLKLKLGAGAAQELARRFSDLSAIENELTKLSSLGDTVTAEQVRRYTGASLEYVVFEMNDLFAKGDMQGGCELFHNIYEAEKSPFGVIGICAYKFRQALRARAMLDVGKNAAEIETALGNRWAAREATETARKYTADRLRGIMTSLAELDAALKSGRLDHYLATEHMLIQAYER